LTLGNKESAASYFSGSILILANVTVLTIAWSFITQKKFVALAVSVIVFKYAILGVIIYRLLKYSWLDPMWMSIGLGSLLLTTILFGLLQILNKEQSAQ